MSLTSWFYLVGLINLRDKNCILQNVKKMGRFDSLQFDLQARVAGWVRRLSTYFGPSLYVLCQLFLLCTGYNSVAFRANALSVCMYTVQAANQDRNICASFKSCLIKDDIHTGKGTRLLWDTERFMLTWWRYSGCLSIHLMLQESGFLFIDSCHNPLLSDLCEWAL